MFEKIMFATDFSPYAENILDYIAGFPGAREVLLLHVIEETWSPRGGGEIGAALSRNGSTLLKKEKHHLEEIGKDLRVTTLVRTSTDPAGAIVDTAEEKNAPLIVVGARGGSMVEGILLGSVSHAVLRRSHTSVLIMRHRVVESAQGRTYEKFSPMILNRVLCPVDFSTYSASAVEELARTPGVQEVILLHVVTRGETRAAIDESIAQARDSLENLRERLSSQGIGVKTQVRAGDPTSEILRIAEEEDVSLIWMSSRGKGWFQQLILGSVACTVAMNAKRPVIIIHSREGEEPNPETER